MLLSLIKTEILFVREKRVSLKNPNQINQQLLCLFIGNPRRGQPEGIQMRMSDYLEFIDEAVRLLIREGLEYLAAVSDRGNEPEISYEDLGNDLKSHGKI
jgi:hypothetical protein